LGLLSAWEKLRAEAFPELKLIVVGKLGWHHKAIVKKYRPWMERGDAFLLEDVPAADLRLLYKHARATICPSFGEGFDFSGVEAMKSGGVVAASDIPVHREIYDDAVEYFNPYSTLDLSRANRRADWAIARHAPRRSRGSGGGGCAALRVREDPAPMAGLFVGAVQRG